jgi:hypothetical protein
VASNDSFGLCGVISYKTDLLNKETFLNLNFGYERGGGRAGDIVGH